MPKVKMARHSTHIDMTAMCDVAFLLLTFFMLATKFKPEEPVVVVTPSSISQIPIPDTSIMLITVDAKSRVFFDIDRKNVVSLGGAEAKSGLINDMNNYKKLGLTPAEKNNFVIGSSIGVPIAQLKSYLAINDGPEKRQIQNAAPGIPVDTSGESPTNELASWIHIARNNNPVLRICIKCDGETVYPTVHKIIATLSKMDINRFNLITSLEEVPKGSAAYENALKTETNKK